MKRRSVVNVMSQHRCRKESSSLEWKAPSRLHPGIDDVDYLDLKRYLSSLSEAYSGVHAQNLVDECPKLRGLERGLPLERYGAEKIPSLLLVF